jgi:CO/xanthine dehydrogenase FAD-binding subunit
MGNQFFNPKSVSEALEIIANHKDYTLLAGGTDVVPLKNLRKKSCLGDIVYIGAIDEMKAITEQPHQLFIGAGVTHAQIAGSELLKEKANNVWYASYHLGTPAIRNVGTIGGNLVNASPSGDSCVALLAAGAQVVIRSIGQNRTVDLRDFFVSKGKTVLMPGEIVYGVTIPSVPEGIITKFSSQRIGLSKGSSTAILNIAAEMETDHAGKSKACRIAVGAVAEVPRRLTEIEKELTGTKVTAELIDHAANKLNQFIAPINDSYATASYRRQVAPVLLKRALLEIAGLSI